MKKKPPKRRRPTKKDLDEARQSIEDLNGWLKAAQDERDAIKADLEREVARARAALPAPVLNASHNVAPMPPRTVYTDEEIRSERYLENLMRAEVKACQADPTRGLAPGAQIQWPLWLRVWVWIRRVVLRRPQNQVERTAEGKWRLKRLDKDGKPIPPKRPRNLESETTT